MLISRSNPVSLLLVAVALLVFGATYAEANPVPFAPNLVIGSQEFGQGSDPNDPVFQAPVDYQLPTTGGEFYGASDSGLDPVEFSLNVCLLASGGSSCVSQINVGDPYSMIVELSLVRVDNPIPPGGMYLLLSGVSPAINYASAAVQLYAHSQPPVPGFTFSPVSRLSRVSARGVTNYYLGFFFTDASASSVTMRFDVDAMVPGGTPSIFTFAAYVPEPSTALMLGLGCVGLAVYRRK